MVDDHTNFWLALLKCGKDLEQQRRYWNGYLAWKLPNDVKFAIRNLGNPPFNQLMENNRLALNGEEKEELNVLAQENGGHPQAFASGHIPHMNFSDRKLPDVSFEGRILLSGAFKHAIFEGNANFRNAIFIESADFGGATFQDGVLFDGATFEDSAHFKGTVFQCHAAFINSTFKAEAYFLDATFKHKLGYQGEVLGGVSFNHATFHDSADFRGVTFGTEADFQHATFHRRTDFQYAKFERSVIFNDALFHAVTTFNGSLFKQPPKFFETKLHEDTDFDGVDWRQAESSYALSWWEVIRDCAARNRAESLALNTNSAIRAWDRLALIMSKLEKLPERHEFYRLRMRAQRRKDRCGLLSLMNWLFDVSSDYGWSLRRAVAFWAGHCAVMAFVLSAGASPPPAKLKCRHVLWDSFLTSFANAHSFLGLASEGGYLNGARECIANQTGWILNAVGVFQTILGPILLFLVLLTVRNRFRLR